MALQSYAARHAAGAARIAAVNGGSVKIYNGSRPAGLTNQSLATYISAATLVVSFTLNSTAFGADSNGTSSLNLAAPQGNGSQIAGTASATGTLSASNTTSGFAVFCDSSNAPVWSCTAGLNGSGAEVTIDVQPQSGGTVNLTGYTHTESAGT